MSNHNKETEARCFHCYRHYEEGTAAWALYMMRMGHKVTNPMYDNRIYHLQEGGMIHVNVIKSIATSQWIDYWCIDIPDGWQLYEEPAKEPKPPKEPDCIICKGCGGSQSVPNPAASNTAYTTCPKCGGTGYEIDEPNPEPAFAVEDWVEYTISGNTFSSKIYGLPYNNIAVVASRKMGLPSVENILTEQITRKLDPSEVRIKVTLEGTVERAGDDRMFLVHRDGHTNACIMLAMLDTPTRELVESLLRAQEEK